MAWPDHLLESTGKILITFKNKIMFGIRTALKRANELERKMDELSFIVSNPPPYNIGDKIESLDLIVIERKIDFRLMTTPNAMACIRRCWIFKAVYTNGEKKGQIIEFTNKFEI